jgi:hypothetical protein
VAAPAASEHRERSRPDYLRPFETERYTRQLPTPDCLNLTHFETWKGSVDGEQDRGDDGIVKGGAVQSLVVV